MDSGDDSSSSSSDDSGSDTGHDASSATTPTCAVSPGVSSTNDGKIKHSVIGGEGTGGPIASALNFQEHQDSSWLNIDDFPGSGPVLEDNITEDNQKIGNIEGKSGSDGTKHGDVEDGSQEMDHNMNGAADGSGDGGTEGWYYSRAFVSVLTLQFQESRIRPTRIIVKPSQGARPMPMKKELVKAIGMGPKEQTIEDIGQKKRGRTQECGKDRPVMVTRISLWCVLRRKGIC